MGFLLNEIKSFSMNELYGADPAIFKTASDLRLLLSAFGPYTGRYLAHYPSDWRARIKENFQNLSEMEVHKINILLQNAKKDSKFFPDPQIPWNETKEWLENAKPLLTHPRFFDGLIAKESSKPNIHHFDELELSPTTEERVLGTATEYLRISKFFLALSPEIAFVDPYLDPLKSGSATVLKVLFQEIAKGKCKKIILWTRASKVFASASVPVIKKDLDNELRKMVSNAKFKSGCEIELRIVDDEKGQNKMHGRYLLSIKGGIRLDQGFQQLPLGRQVDVAPIGKKSHDALFDIYFDGKHDMPIVEKISLKV